MPVGFVTNREDSPMHPFRAAVEAGDFDAIPEMLAEDVVFHSPVLYKPFEGREKVLPVLHAAFNTLKDFRYETELSSEDGLEHALVFRAMVRNQDVHGCDFIRQNEAGEIVDFTVMLRPLSTVQTVGEVMLASIAASKKELGVDA
jgi:hypothetical protein